MLKSLLSAITGIDSSIDDDEHQEAWERQKYLDENDLDGDLESDATDDDDDSTKSKGWFSLW
jgi:hypothetical protein